MDEIVVCECVCKYDVSVAWEKTYTATGSSDQIKMCQVTD